MTNDIDYWQRMANRLYDRVLADVRIIAQNRRYIEDHITLLKAKNMHPRSVIRHIYGILKLMEALGYDKDLKVVTKRDMEKAAAFINSYDPPYSMESRLHFQAVWKVFYKELLGEGVYQPPCVAWMKITNKTRKNLMPDNILTEQEIVRMLDAATNLRDKFFLSLLYETGCRIGEIMGVRKKDLDLTTQPAKLTITGKTGWRKVPLLMSVSLAVTYLNTIKDLKDDQIIWRQIGSSKGKDKPMTDDSARKLLRVIGHRAGITKPINPHAFRKARASHLANKLSDQQLRAYFGWVPSSNMADYYIRVSNTALDNAYLEINGIEVKKEAYQAMLKPKMCIRCSFSNSPDMQFCGRCGSALDTQTAIQMDEDRKNIDNALNAYIKSSDPKALKEELSHIILKLDRMQKTKRR